MLLIAKSEGWSGGHDIVEEITNENNEQFVLNKKIDNYVRISSTHYITIKITSSKPKSILD